MGGDPVSNRDYYQEHKERINRAKRLRYRKDKAYRDAAKARAKNQTLLKKVRRIAERNTVKHGGNIERIFTLRELCTAIDRSRDVIFRWRKSGVMPRPTHYRGSHGVYAMSQLAYMKTLCKFMDDGTRLSYAEFGRILKVIWKKPFSLATVEQQIMKALSKRKGAKDGNKKR